jgi:hypothetical protein
MKMKTRLPITVLIACAAAVVVQAETPPASTLSMAEPAFRNAEVSVLEGASGKFEIVLEREMPTPGWTFTVDALEPDERSRRIVVRVTENRPEGMVAQVITPARLYLPLGPLAKGRHVLEIRLRRGGAGEHRLVQAFVLVAG